MKNIKPYEGFLNEGIMFTKDALMNKLRQKLEIADKAIEKWGDSYKHKKQRIEDAIRSEIVGPDSGILNVQGDGPKDSYEIFSGSNATDLATEISKIIKKYKEHEVEASSVPAAAGWSGNMRSTVSGFIRGVANEYISGGYYGTDKNFLLGVQIGGGVDKEIKKKL